MSQTTPTIDKADKCLQTLKMFVFTRPVPSEVMRECDTHEFYFLERTDKGKKNKTM